MSCAPEQPITGDAPDEEIDPIVAEFDGNPKMAILALLHDLPQLALDSDAAVSRGYVRGNLFPFRLRKPE